MHKAKKKDKEEYIQLSSLAMHHEQKHVRNCMIELYENR